MGGVPPPPPAPPIDVLEHFFKVARSILLTQINPFAQCNNLFPGFREPSRPSCAREECFLISFLASFLVFFSTSFCQHLWHLFNQRSFSISPPPPKPPHWGSLITGFKPACFQQGHGLLPRSLVSIASYDTSYPTSFSLLGES